MATKKKKSKKSKAQKQKYLRIVISAIVIALVLFVLYKNPSLFLENDTIPTGIIEQPLTNGENPSNNINEVVTNTPTPNTDTETLNGLPLLSVYYLNVGQADCILLMTEDEVMLIDGGNDGDGKYIVDYFNQIGISKINYVVATHPDEDHIGGLDEIINAFEIDNVIWPNQENDSDEYKSLKKAIESQGLGEGHQPEIGETFDFGQGEFTVLSVKENQSNTNKASVVLKLVYGDSSFIFTGDATTSEEKAVIKAGFDVDVDILKLGHHGSKTSNSDEWLTAVSPEICVISVGEKNKFKHPSQEVIDRLSNYDTTVYRTDLDGTILIVTDGDESDGEEYAISFPNINLDSSFYD